MDDFTRLKNVHTISTADDIDNIKDNEDEIETKSNHAQIIVIKKHSTRQ